jgi:geranylgeranyl diphosphate synthase type I
VRQASSALDILATSRKMLDPHLRAAVDRLPGMLRRIAGYHFGWWDADERPVTASPGKAIRPALVLLAAEAVEGDVDNAMPAAVAVELVHNFSQLHDDVMDVDRLRRNRPTAWTVFGVSQAILAGDAMASLASAVLSDSAGPWAANAVRWLNDCVVDLCDGQFLDVAFEQLERVDLAECLRMVHGKTSALLGVSCALGALAGGATARQVDQLRQFGYHLGLAFQLVDDLLGIWGDPGVTGKPVGADLARRKKSLPVVAALASGTAAGAELARTYKADTPVEVARASELVEAAGGRKWAETRADEELAHAMACLDYANCAPRARGYLVDVADLVVRRNH